MQPDTATKSELDAESPESNINVSNTKDNASGTFGLIGEDGVLFLLTSSHTGRPQSSGKANNAQNGTANGQFPPPKTDKPRPHVCGTCGRSFARLEHLKRHERSHTKEKPFECPECTRCFARRDLLLRHQQKLHMTNTTSSRPRNGRRESVSSASVTNGRVRKNSIANGSVAGSTGISATHRPRANTISHIDISGLALMDTTNPTFSRMNVLGLANSHMGMGGLPGAMNFDYRGMSNAIGHHGNHGLPKLDTRALNDMDISNSLRTAPPYASFGGFDVESLFGQGSTINPAHLHFGGSSSATQPTFPPLEPFTVHAAIDPNAQENDFGWMRNWNMQMSHENNNETAIEESSPSRMSSGDSPGDYTDSMANSTGAMPIQNNFQWPQQDSNIQQALSAGPFQLDALGTGLPNLDPPQATISPNTLHDPTPTADAYFPQAMMQQHQQPRQSPPEMMQSSQHNFFPPSVSNFNSDSPSMSGSSMTGSARQSSVTSISTDSITDATRQALLLTLSQPSVFGHNHRKYSQPTISSPLSPGGTRSSIQGPNLPTTADIRRFVDAFITHAHPHLPVLHIPTLSFDALEYSVGIKGSSPHLGMNQNGSINGGGCLILGMAAIGALYEYEHPASKELFDGARKMISLYLEERRKTDIAATVNGPSPGNEASHHTTHTPLWLVQAMLLNVVYGHQCGDKTAADIASNHASALVSLARAADLAQPPQGSSPTDEDAIEDQGDSNDVEMGESTIAPADSASRHQSAETDLQTQWYTWKVAEERKRTLFAIFILSSLLTTAYNHTPTIMNSEIRLDLPCDEQLWSAESAQEWQNRGGLAAAEANAVSFAEALGTLLTANQRRQNSYSSNAYPGNNAIATMQSSDTLADVDLRPSTFGCLVLINALHNYIWETRNRHHGRQWTSQENDSMFSFIEPALTAWQSAWKANEHHKIERPNPFGMGPLSADSVPLLDLAYVRLFVNLGRSKEAFWHREFDRMADELARGSEIVQHAESSPTTGEDRKQSVGSGSPSNQSPSNRRQSQTQTSDQGASSRRERHLRKAAHYAADSLTWACRYGLTYTDPIAHELPVQSAMCFFDCSQVLAEWACTVQERVGSFLGVIGREQVDWATVPAIMMLEHEDVELFHKIQQICESLETKRFQQENMLAINISDINQFSIMNSVHNGVHLSNCGYGSKILRITAMMLEKAVVWPGKQL